jgi:hypothetical protein
MRNPLSSELDLRHLGMTLGRRVELAPVHAGHAGE